MRLTQIISLCCFSLLLSWQAEAGYNRAKWTPERDWGTPRLRVDTMQSITLPTNANDKLKAAALDLQSVFSDQVGGTLQLSLTENPPAKQTILLELSPNAPREGGFHIERDHSRIRIRSASQDGLAHGIYTLCRDFFKARWYWAGELGLEYIGSAPTHFPAYREVVRPSFVQRSLYPSNSDFARRNRLVGGFQFNHNLAKVFNVERFNESPQAFSVVLGARRRPKGSGAMDPQPNFADPAAVEIAANAALEYFTQHPDSRSFSLSINDNSLYDESEATRERVSPVRYFRQSPDYSELVFSFMNAVAVRVFEQGGAWQTASGEDRYLTALAYSWTENAPSFPIHPRVMPVLTSDRAQWHDPAYRAEDRELIQRWAESGAERIATWDYYFGAPYPYPRQFNHWIDTSLKYLHAQGVDVFFSQLPAAWGLDGAKAWLATELLWDTQQDATALLDEYYSHFFGAAAEPIRNFYEMAEAHRNAHAGRAAWIKYYKDIGGISLFPVETLQAMREQIEQAQIAVAQDPRRLARVEIVSEAFDFTESYAAYQRAREALYLAIFEDSAELPAHYTAFTEQRDRYDAIAPAIVAQPMHALLKGFTKLIQPDPTAMAQLAMLRLGQALPETTDPALQIWTALGQRAALPAIIKNSELTHSGTRERNFLGPEIPIIEGWEYTFRPTEWLSVTPAKGQTSGICISGANMFVLYQDIRVEAGASYLLETTLQWHTSPDNRIYFKLSWKDQRGKLIRSEIRLQLSSGHSSRSQSVQIPIQAPPGAHKLRIHIVNSRQSPEDFLQVDHVQLSGGER